MSIQNDERQRTDQPTRKSRLKWVVAVDRGLAPGLMVNAAVCTAATVGDRVPGLVGPDGRDAAGSTHPGLPWAGCTVLGADAGTLRELRAAAAAAEDVLVVDMPAAAQRVRVYDDYLDLLGGSGPDDVWYLAVGIVGPRKRIDKLTARLPLLR